MKQKCSPLLSKEEIEGLFFNTELFLKKSFHFIDNESLTYDENRERGSIPEEAQFIKLKLREGHTIIIKNLESLSPTILSKCESLGENVDLHLYLVPENGNSSFDFHADDRDVLVHLVYGEKKFFIKDAEGIEKEILLEAEDELSIPKGTLHKAIPKGASCLLSFGAERFHDSNQADL
jgi:mannose-6-phosphate isomerase-like protein (cupin superfamily)